MTRLLKNISAIVVVAMIIAAVAIPAFAAVNALSYNASWETNDIPSHLKIRSTLTYSGGNGNWVDYYSNAVSNTGILSTLTGESTASSTSATGNWADCNATEIPFVRSHSGSPWYR